MGRRHLPAFEFGNPVFQPSHALYQLVRVAKPNINRTRPLIESPQQFGLGIADLFGQRIVDLPNSLGDIVRRFFINLPNGIGKILLRYWLTVHI